MSGSCVLGTEGLIRTGPNQGESLGRYLCRVLNGWPTTARGAANSSKLVFFLGCSCTANLANWLLDLVSSFHDSGTLFSSQTQGGTLFMRRFQIQVNNNHLGSLVKRGTKDKFDRRSGYLIIEVFDYSVSGKAGYLCKVSASEAAVDGSDVHTKRGVKSFNSV